MMHDSFPPTCASNVGVYEDPSADSRDLELNSPYSASDLRWMQDPYRSTENGGVHHDQVVPHDGDDSDAHGPYLVRS